MVQTVRAGLVILSLLLGHSLYGQPWGKDADLAQYHPNRCDDCAPAGRASKVAQAIIRFHQQVLSPADGPRSHFRPSSSQYAMQAIKKHGFLKGYVMGCDRLMRENSELWVYRRVRLVDGSDIKWDPVR